MTEPSRQSIVKDQYNEVGQNFRHFLAWRRLLFAGYFAVIAGLGSVFEWDEMRTSNLNSILLIIAILLTILFWALDLRNRQLIQNISDAGANLEKELDLSETGSYSIYKNEDHLLTHSGILAFFYGLAILAFASSFIATVSFDNGNILEPPTPNKSIQSTQKNGATDSER